MCKCNNGWNYDTSVKIIVGLGVGLNALFWLGVWAYNGFHAF